MAKTLPRYAPRRTGLCNRVSTMGLLGRGRVWGGGCLGGEMGLYADNGSQGQGKDKNCCGPQEGAADREHEAAGLPPVTRYFVFPYVFPACLQ